MILNGASDPVRAGASREPRSAILLPSAQAQGPQPSSPTGTGLKPHRSKLRSRQVRLRIFRPYLPSIDDPITPGISALIAYSEGISALPLFVQPEPLLSLHSFPSGLSGTCAPARHLGPCSFQLTRPT